MPYPEKYGSLTIESNRLLAIEGVPRLKSRLILLMGTTGSGKSKFIESFCPEQFKNPTLSGNSLNSVTQEITAYRIYNAVWSTGIPIVLIDTPGFSDPNLSEGKIVFALQEWLAVNETDYYHHILYFERITDNRMSGHKQRLLRIFKALVGPDAAPCVTIVTSMWDQLWTAEQLQTAEDRYLQLQNEHWKELIEQGSIMVKFYCTKMSAVQVLGKGLSTGGQRHKFAFFTQEADTIDADGIPPPYMGMLHSTICERIDGMETRLRAIEEDLIDASTRSDKVLEDYLQGERLQVQQVLQTFKNDLDTIKAVSPSLDPPAECIQISQQELTVDPTSTTHSAKKRWWKGFI